MKIEKYFDIDRELAQKIIDTTADMAHERSGDNGFQKTRVFLFEEYAVLKMQNMNFRNVDTEDADLKHLERLAVTLLDLRAKGVNVVPILAFQSDNGNGYIIQPRAKGAELYDRDKLTDKNYVLQRVETLSKAPQEHFDKFVADTIQIVDNGVIVDFWGKDNFFYDKDIGFQFIDLNAHNDYEYGLSHVKPDAKQIALFGCFVPCYYDTMPQHRDTVSKIMPELTDSERVKLKAYNKYIFEKCKSALINSGISEEALVKTTFDEQFIPQIRQWELNSIIKTHDITLYGSTEEYDIDLCPLCDDHLPLLYKWSADPEVLYWTEGGTADTNLSYDADTVHHIYGGVSQNAFCFLIKADGVPIGECWLQKMNLPEVKAMYPKTLDVRRIDMSVGEKAYWNKGIGTQFIGMLIDFAFNDEYVDVLHCFSEDYNMRSCRMWEKHGFTRILEEPLEPQPQKGKWQYHYRLTRKEFVERRR